MKGDTMPVGFVWWPASISPRISKRSGGRPPANVEELGLGARAIMIRLVGACCSCLNPTPK